MQQSVFGETRTRVKRRHALIAPDGHVPSNLAGFTGATPFHLISPAMGASFSQLLVVFEENGETVLPALENRQRFVYVETGEVRARCGSLEETLAPGGYLYAAGDEVTITSREGARLTVFEAAHQPASSGDSLPVISGDATRVEGEPFLGNPRTMLQVLLPDDPAWDMAVNLFTYEPGATLPFVETHIMEHGLLMLSGQGVYRLGDDYYPVARGDVIWMAPYCPQWFVAMGDEPASYLYYKNVNRPA